MDIAIIADINFQKQLNQMLELFEKFNNIVFKKRYFNDEKSFLSYDDRNLFKIILIYNYDGNLSMFHFATTIRQKNSSCNIIFCSNSSKFAVEGYKINLTYYLIIPFNYDDFSFAINKCLEKYIKTNKYIVINSGWQKIPIKINDIQFAEKIDHNVVIHTEKKTFSTRITFSDFLKKLEEHPQFVYCVRGALVNFYWVDSIENQNFLMKNGNRISIRRKDRKKIKQLYNNFVNNNLNSDET